MDVESSSVTLLVAYCTGRLGIDCGRALSALVIHRTAILDHHSHCTRPFSGGDINLGQLCPLFRPPRAEPELAEPPHTIQQCAQNHHHYPQHLTKSRRSPYTAAPAYETLAGFQS
jgi:hypothetical protein